MAASGAAKEALWLRQLLLSVGIELKEPTTLLEDNEATIKLMHSIVESQRTKHYDIACKCTRERILQTKEIDMIYCYTGDMIADALTKPLERTKFEQFRNLMVMDKDEFARLKGIVPPAKA